MNARTIALASALLALGACGGEQAAGDPEPSQPEAGSAETAQSSPATQAYYGDRETPETLEAHDHPAGGHGHDHDVPEAHAHDGGDHDHDAHGHDQEEDDHGHDH